MPIKPISPLSTKILSIVLSAFLAITGWFMTELYASDNKLDAHIQLLNISLTEKASIDQLNSLKSLCDVRNIENTKNVAVLQQNYISIKESLTKIELKLDKLTDK